MVESSLEIRTARIDELGALTTLMELAVGELLKPFLNAAEIASSRTIMGLDSQLVKDGTFRGRGDGHVGRMRRLEPAGHDVRRRRLAGPRPRAARPRQGRRPGARDVHPSRPLSGAASGA